MGITRDEHTVEIAGSTVAVTGTTGAVHATWTLVIDGENVETAAAAGDFHLRGTLADGTAVKAAIHQSLVGPTRVVITHQDVEVLDERGFVA
jgi:hypothetical protein